MSRILSTLLNLILLAFASCGMAQNITGSWEGRIGDEFLQLNIVQKNNELCGYSYDYRLANPYDHCKARFSGFYNAKEDAWVISGNTFIENSGSHVLMRIILWRTGKGKITTLKGVVMDPAEVSFVMKKVPTIPLRSIVPECFPKPDPPVKKESKQAAKKVSPPIAQPKKKTPPKKPTVVEKALPPVKDKQEVKVEKVEKKAPVPTIPDNSQLISKMNARRKSEVSRLEVNVKRIQLKVYDNGVVDNDTVTIFYNKSVLLRKKRLSDKPLLLDIDLDPGVQQHEITMYADNLGSIPPNTALIVVTAGNKRYELHSSASLEENAVLIFDYKP